MSGSGNDADAALHPFHRVNIHERRWAALIARAIPMAALVATVVVVAVGAFRSTPLLLACCAVMNVSMWLFICSLAVFGILGAKEVEAAILPGPTATCQGVEEAVPTAGSLEGQDRVRHVIVLPNYKEDEEMLEETVRSLAESDGSEDFWVVLAMEEREGKDAVEKAERVKAKFRDSFANVLAFFHPANLREEHLDGSWSQEVPGKASNLKWAVAKTSSAMKEDASTGIHSVVLTVADADCLFHPSYFAHITREFDDMRSAPGEQHRWTMWQAPQLPYRNYYLSHAPARVWGYISSVYEFGGVSSLSAGGHHMVFSAYSVSLQLAVEAELWDGDVIAEDHHAFLKGFFHSVRVSAMEVLSATDDKQCRLGVRPALRVRSVMLPVKSTSVVHPDGWWASWLARWQQATRHCQGVAEVSYALLATWDLLCTLPLRVYNLHFVMQLFKLLFRPIFMHIVPIAQAFALGVLTLYWLLHNRSIPQCPDRIWMASSDGETLLCGLAGAWVLTWPILIPFVLMALSNYLFIRVSFMKPNRTFQDGLGKSGKPMSLWHACDAGVPTTWGSRALTLILLIVLDCLVLMGPLMVPYGLLAEVIGCWNVLFFGNHITYVTATKATSATLAGRDYGATASSLQAPDRQAADEQKA
mmetsp:Transcript_106120/g.300067  ORF Transcript_106120/g.300067 Transcript_106120/m.300067 type:complete len:643 (+) Transcript_106120:96-2024(+)